MIIACKSRLNLFNLGEQRAALVGQFRFEGCDLAFDFFQRTSNAIGGHNAQRVCRGDEVVVRQPKLTVGTWVPGRPVKLLGVDLHAQRVV